MGVRERFCEKRTRRAYDSDKTLPRATVVKREEKNGRTTSHTFSLQRAYKEPLFSHKTIEVSKRIPTDSKCGSCARSGMRKCQKRCGSRAYTHAYRNLIDNTIWECFKKQATVFCIIANKKKIYLKKTCVCDKEKV